MGKAECEGLSAGLERKPAGERHAVCGEMAGHVLMMPVCRTNVKRSAPARPRLTGASRASILIGENTVETCWPFPMPCLAGRGLKRTPKPLKRGTPSRGECVGGMARRIGLERAGEETAP